MDLVHELPAGLENSLDAAMRAERRAAACDRDLADHFAGRNLGALASLCRNLATRHEETLREASEDSPVADEPWLDDDAREFVLRVAGPRQLLQVALANESEVSDLYDQLLRRDTGPMRPTAARLAERAHEAVRQLSIALEAVPAAPDWEQLIAAGAVPALALGAERRVRRAP